MTAIRHMLLLLALLAQNALADVLILSDGTKLQGKYAGGTRTRLRFEVDGKIRTIFIDEVQSLTFGRNQEIQKPALPSAKRPEKPTVQRPSIQPIRTGRPTLTIAKNTPLSTHLTRAITTQKNKKNDRFTVHLSKAVTKGTRILLPSQTLLHGRLVHVQSIKKGHAVLKMELTSAQIDNHIRTLISNTITLECDGDLLTVTSGESAFSPDIALGDFITEDGEIQLPENTPITFHLASPLEVPEK